MYSPPILTVTQLNTYTKSILDADQNLACVFVIGEISNFVDHYRSGHLYMSIKDENSSIKAVMFAGNASRLKFRPENGMSVIIRGRATIYERDGQFQLYIDDMQPDGLGAEALRFEQLKRKLEKEGIFSPEHKKKIPVSPMRVGVISSPTGAAVQDVLNVLSRRFPLAQVVFAPVKVQGEGAAEQVALALHAMNEKRAADVVIIARGGGSAEDLSQFNSEKLAYEIYNSNIPVISGVGHETDFTICDFAADLRAPTPSAAAELAVPDIGDMSVYLLSLKKSLLSAVNEKIKACEYKLNTLSASPVMLRPVYAVEGCEQQLDRLTIRLRNAVFAKLQATENRFTQLNSALEAIGPKKVLNRGYSIVKSGDRIIKSSRELKAGDEITVRLSQGSFRAVITEVTE